VNSDEEVEDLVDVMNNENYENEDMDLDDMD
jgi:hypothetical protein